MVSLKNHPYDFDVKLINQEFKYSVKTITPENDKQSTQIKLDGEWDRLLIIKLDKDFRCAEVLEVSHTKVSKHIIKANPKNYFKRVGDVLFGPKLNQKTRQSVPNDYKDKPYSPSLRWDTREPSKELGNVVDLINHNKLSSTTNLGYKLFTHL
jgi:hypothetical protein